MKGQYSHAVPVRLVATMLGVMLVGMLMFLPGGSADARTGDTVVPVRGELSDGGTFKGRIINPEVFPKNNGKLAMSGTLRGTTTTESGEVETVNQKFTAPLRVVETDQSVRVAQASCPILSLDLGPLNLDLLGLQVDLEPVVLDVTAVPGAGNLLGNLLCAVAGLLDGFDLGGAISDTIADLLNTILDGIFGDLLS